MTFNFNKTTPNGFTMDWWGIGRGQSEVLKAKIYRNNNCTGSAVGESAYLANTAYSYEFTDDLSGLTESQDVYYSAKVFYASQSLNQFVSHYLHRTALFTRRL